MTRGKNSTGFYETIIVGAGITGLTLGERLSSKGRSVLILEKKHHIGGLAKSFVYNYRGKKFIFDIGPKRFHTSDESVSRYINQMLGKNITTIDRKSSIFAFNRYLDWPITTSSVFRLPLSIQVKITLDVFRKFLNITVNDHSERFDSYIIRRYGQTIYKYFFKDYTEKFSRIPAEQLDKSWAYTSVNRAIIDKKINANNISDLVRMAFIPKPVKTEFIYPNTGGFGYFCTRLSDIILNNSGAILTGCKITNLNYQQKSIVVNNNRYRFKNLIWTGNIHDLEKLLGFEQSNLTYLNTIFYNIIIKTGEPLAKYQWIYCHYKKFGVPLKTVRISFPNNFSDYLIPKNFIGICLERTTLEKESFWKNPEMLIPEISKELIVFKIIKKLKDIKLIKIEKVPDTYPIYQIGYKNKYRKFQYSLKKNYPKIFLLGRTGSFWYNNSDHSIKSSLIMANYLTGKVKSPPNKDNIF